MFLSDVESVFNSVKGESKVELVILIWGHREGEILLSICFQEFSELGVLRFRHLLKIGLGAVDVLGQNRCLEVDKRELKSEGDDVQGLINKVQAPALLLAIVTHDEELLICVCELEHFWLATSTSDQVVNDTFGGHENEAFVRDPASTVHSLMEFFLEGKGLLIAIFRLLLPRSGEGLFHSISVILKEIEGIFESQDKVVP